MDTKLKNNLVGLKELRENMNVYIKRIESGESLIVIRRNKPVFTISPTEKSDDVWETVVDFTTINQNGVSAKDVLKRLGQIHG